MKRHRRSVTWFDAGATELDAAGIAEPRREALRVWAGIERVGVADGDACGVTSAGRRPGPHDSTTPFGAVPPANRSRT